ncbi:MAG TPA: helix-turn-helix domain-containing protein [Pyrinomonadaceae bacterium]|nr:helix-turn-helix domain-containing protein [Pyrinomonadaceae bacterium]
MSEVERIYFILRSVEKSDAFLVRAENEELARALVESDFHDNHRVLKDYDDFYVVEVPPFWAERRLRIAEEKPNQTLEEAMADFECKILITKLIERNYNISAVAKELGLTRRGLYWKMERYGLGQFYGIGQSDKKDDIEKSGSKRIKERKERKAEWMDKDIRLLRNMMGW